MGKDKAAQAAGLGGCVSALSASCGKQPHSNGWSMCELSGCPSQSSYHSYAHHMAQQVRQANQNNCPILFSQETRIPFLFGPVEDNLRERKREGRAGRGGEGEG